MTLNVTNINKELQFNINYNIIVFCSAIETFICSS